MATLKLSDALFQTAEAVRKIAEKSNIQLKITDIYKDENLETLALLSSLLRQFAERSSNQKIEVSED